ncbi:MAG: ATP-dependent Clp protease ATP-binding subunit [Eubacteriales bacterium]|nr:ATP-dependent Clp protease ATP-binding subunit [Eubacteriales bacterium]
MQYTEQVKTALKLAEKSAVRYGQGYIGSEHLLAGLLREGRGMAAAILRDNHVDEEKLSGLIRDLIVPEEQTVLQGKPKYSPRAEAILSQAETEAAFFGQAAIGTEHLLLALLKDTDAVATRLLHTMGVPVQKVFLAVLDSLNLTEDRYQEYSAQASGSTAASNDGAMLKKYSLNLTEQAAKGKLDPVIGRDQEIGRVIQILSRRTKNNPCLIGEAGVGKTAIVEGLAQRIVSGNVPEIIKNKQIYTLDMASMVAGSKYRGEFEERIKKVISEVSGREDVLLFIDELHTIIGAGGAEGAMDASNIMKPALSRGELQLIGATTIEEYRKHIEKDPALERRFQSVMVEEPTEEEAVSILYGLRSAYEEHHHVAISDEAVEAAVSYSARYISDRFLPDKAIDLIDEAAARKQLLGTQVSEENEELKAEIEQLSAEREQAIFEGDWDKAQQKNQLQEELTAKYESALQRAERRLKKKKQSVSEEDIAEIVAVRTGIPVQRLAEKESKRLRRLEETLEKRVIGQDEAVKAVSKAVKRGRVGLKDPKRPIGSFLFLGPTGVGKTELSKVLSEVVFGTEQSMIRVDMSEYMEKHSVSKLVGSPPGYVGYEEGGQLSEKVRRNPYSVILFDEIEKAHPDVFNILLQVLDDGHITDAQGRKVDFKNTILIMTSNAGAKSIMEPKKLGFMAVEDASADYQRMKNSVMEEVRRTFKPEFINRIDDIIVFHALGMEEIEKITALLLKEFEKRCREQMNITLRIQDAVKKSIAEKAFDAKYGARPLKRAIQNRLEDALAEEILEGNVHQGDVVNVSMKDDRIRFKVKS